MSLVAGTRLGPYEIQSAIGAGGRGEVYKARDTRLDRTVAIKVLPPDVSGDPERRARFEREARTLAALDHPHICRLYDVGEHSSGGPGQPVSFLVMEHLAGLTLAERLAHGPLPLCDAMDVATEIADALAAAHRQGVLHHDLRPGNVMLTETGGVRPGSPQAKLIGFGPAGLKADPGTLRYKAPEQLEGREDDARSGIFSFGAMLYEMLTGLPPFGGTGRDSVIAAILACEPSPLSEVQPFTPRPIERLVSKCLQKDPDARWQSASDVADELRWVAATGVSSSLAAPPLVGTWRLVSFESRTASGEIHRPLGSAPVGQLVYDASGHMSVQLMDPNRRPFESGDFTRGSDAELRAAVGGYVAYYGTYSLDPLRGVVTHHVLGALFPNWVGRDQVRCIRIEGYRLTLTTPPMRVGGENATTVLVWERAR